MSINAVGLGVYRNVAAKMDIVFQNTPYRIAAIVDLKTSPEGFTYSAHNFGTVLYALHPPPQVFVVGAAITESMANESISVWEEYIKYRGTQNTLMINLSGEPPKDGDWMKHILSKLDEKYKNHTEL